MDEIQIELMIIGELAQGARYADDIVDELGLSKKEAVDILHQMWLMGTVEKHEDRVHDRGRPRVAYSLVGELNSKEFYSDPDDIDLLP